MSNPFRTLDDADVAGKRVLLRVDLNVPTENGRVTDKTRIERVAETMKEIADKGGKVILLAHFGRPKGGPDEANSLRPVAEAVAEVIGRPVGFVGDCVGKVAADAIGTMRNGDILLLEAPGDGGARVAGKAPVGRVLIDGTRTGEVGDEVLRDRRHLAEDGLVVPVVAINKQTGLLEGVPDIITRGFVMENSQELLADGARVLSEVIEQSSIEERTDQGLIKEKLRTELRRFFRKRLGRRPFVLPVIMEI